jgi:hypothetical protein
VYVECGLEHELIIIESVCLEQINRTYKGGLVANLILHLAKRCSWTKVAILYGFGGVK